MAGIPLASLEYVVNHVVLPPKLPQQVEEPNISLAGDCQLIDLVVATVQSYRQRCTDLPALDGCWAIINTALARYGQLLSTPSLSAEDVTNLLQLLKPAGKFTRST